MFPLSINIRKCSFQAQIERVLFAKHRSFLLLIVGGATECHGKYSFMITYPRGCVMPSGAAFRAFFVSSLSAVVHRCELLSPRACLGG